MGLGLFWGGLILQVAGLVVTATGVRRTWREFAAEPFWSPVIQRARGLWERIVARVRRVFRRPQIVFGEAAGEIRMAGTALGRVGFRTIPEDGPVADAITELDERTRRLLDQIADLREQGDEELRTLRSESRSLREEVARVVKELGEMDREVAVSGLRLEAAGMFLIALGVVFQGVSTLAG